MKVIILMAKEKEMKNVFGEMVIILQDNGKIFYFMEKKFFIIQMEKLYMKVIGLMMNQ